jgi:lactate dehydrogenase-like 2-hydroxyacid dehydrogenase
MRVLKYALFSFPTSHRIEMMKPGTMLVNVSRGGLVDTDSVFEGLENGQLGSVGLDVYEDEGEGRAVYEDEGEGRAARERFKVDESPEQLF